MSDDTRPSQQQGDPGLAFPAFVAFIASIMALNALGIDSMLPALPAIGESYKIASENERQWVIVVFMFGFGSAQIIWGPLADRFGRKPILASSLLLYALFSFIAAMASSFPMLLVMRALQGVASSASRVLVVSIVRDCFSGRRMARVMSLSFMVFLAVPILAPSIGQVIAHMFGGWQAIFYAIGIYALAMSIVAQIKLRETLHPEYRQALTPGSIATVMWRVITNRMAIGYTVAAGLTFACITGFISSVQQVFADVFGVVSNFPIMFACMAGGMGVGSFLNSRLVERLGTRRISHTALLGFIAVAIVHLLVAWSGHETLVTFLVLQCLQMSFFGLIGANFNSMAMEPMGDVAGAAASVQGFLSTCLGALLGSLIGQAFNGTTVPLATGFALFGLSSLVVVLIAERGKLFRAQHSAPAVSFDH
jgi:MFS transporter, DHA1 family, multidrug resistance protein